LPYRPFAKAPAKEQGDPYSNGYFSITKDFAYSDFIVYSGITIFREPKNQNLKLLLSDFNY